MSTPAPAFAVPGLVDGSRSDQCALVPQPSEVASEAADTGGTSALYPVPLLITGCGVTPRSGVSAAHERAQTPPAVHARVSVFLRNVTAGVTTQPCCDQRLPGPQGSLSGVLAFTGAVLGASTGACSCLGGNSWMLPPVVRVTRVQLFRPPPPPRPCRPSLAGGLGRLLRVFQRLPSRGAHVDEDGLTCPRNGQTLAFPGLEKRVLLSLLTLGTAGQVCDAPSWPAGSAICCVHARRGPCPACSVIAGPFPGRLRGCAQGPRSVGLAVSCGPASLNGLSRSVVASGPWGGAGSRPVPPAPGPLPFFPAPRPPSPRGV